MGSAANDTIMYRLTVNGVTSDPVTIHIETMYSDSCMCGCGMPGCTCGPECPLHGAGGELPQGE